MPADLLTRLFWAIGIIALGWLVFQAINWLILARVQNRVQQGDLIQPGKLAILYFTTPDCAPCKTVQRPALERVQETLGDRLQVIEVNAYEQPDLAKSWGVMSVPTTFIIDARGKPRHVNHGATRADRLFEQIRSLE